MYCTYMSGICDPICLHCFCTAYAGWLAGFVPRLAGCFRTQALHKPVCREPGYEAHIVPWRVQYTPDPVAACTQNSLCLDTLGD